MLELFDGIQMFGWGLLVLFLFINNYFCLLLKYDDLPHQVIDNRHVVVVSKSLSINMFLTKVMLALGAFAVVGDIDKLIHINDYPQLGELMAALGVLVMLEMLVASLYVMWVSLTD